MKGSLIRCVTAGSRYKAINIIFEYWNVVYTINIKNNNNSTYNTEATLIRFVLYSNPFTTFRKGIERLFERFIKGIYIINDPFTNVIFYIFKLYKDGITKKILTLPNTKPFNILNIYIIR